MPKKTKPTPPLTDAQALEALTFLYDERRWAEVVDYAEAWLAARGTMPPLAALWYGSGLAGVGRYDESLTWTALAAKGIPSTPADPWITSRLALGHALARSGSFEQAQTMYRAALRLPATDRAVATGQAHLRLAVRDRSWLRGWADHERARIGGDRAPVIPGIPYWDGGPTDGPVVILHEQGIGDAAMFARYVPWVEHASGHPVRYAAPAMLKPYLSAIPGVEAVYTPEDAFDESDPANVKLRVGAAAVRIFSLPALHGTQRHTIPAPLGPDVPRSTRGDRLRVGVSWQGAATNAIDHERSIPLADFAPLWRDPNPRIEWVSCQYNTPIPEEYGLTGWENPEGTPLDTATRLASCDLVVTVETAVAHIAGSLGIPTIVLVPTTPDWRWVPWPDGTETPWYPSVVTIRRERADAIEPQVLTARALVDAYAAEKL